MTGQRVLHYEIQDELGAGGMGVVYRALDTHLHRPVALKVLKRSALGDPERRRRFVQEARTASSLSHPNIVTIYDINSAEVDGETVDVIVMEYIAGKTLDRHINRKGLRIAETLRLAAQIADGLAAAHAAGIVHRDLKPSNVMVTGQGLVKLVDFGLAKVADTGPVDVFAATESLHLDAAMTVEGSILGTVAYMSPEQAEGRKVDARSDIFSFGSMLYEMLCGRQAFGGESKLAALSAILLKDPPPIADTAEPLPPRMEKILARCFRKEPDRRWQSIADLRVELEELRDEVESNRSSGILVQTAAKIGRRTRARWWQPALAGLLLGAVGSAVVVPRFVRPPRPSFERLTFRRGDIISGRFAPGGTILYSAEWDGKPRELFSVVPGTREGRPLGLKDAEILSVSSTGEMALLMGPGHNMLARAPIGGGAPRDVMEGAAGAGWSPDGKELAVVRVADGRYRLEYPIGTILDENANRRQEALAVSPRGDAVAYFDHDAESGDYSVCLVNRARQKRVLARGYRTIAGMAWSPGGGEIWYSGARSNELVTMRAVTLAGSERQVLEGASWLHLLDIARDGRVLVSSVYGRVMLRWMPPGGTQEEDLSWLETSLIYDMAPDAKSLVFAELQQGQGRNKAIYFRKTDGSPAVHLGDGSGPVLSPDGKWVLSVNSDRGNTKLVLTPTGPGEARVLPGEGFRYEPGEWFPDSKRVLFAASRGGRPARMWTQSIEGGEPTAVTEEGVRANRISPDGSTVTYANKGTLFLLPVAGGAPRELVALEPGESAVRWSADGRRIFTMKLDGARRQWLIQTLDARSGRRETVRKIVAPDAGARLLGGVALSADGRSYAYSLQHDLCNLFLIQGLR